MDDYYTEAQSEGDILNVIAIDARGPRTDVPTWKRTNSRGFTVVEFLVVVLIVLAIVAAALPSINETLDGYQLYSTASEVSSQIQNVRYRALKTNTTVSFLATGSNFGTDANADGNLTSSQDTSLTLPAGVTFVQLTSPPVSGAVNLTPSGSNVKGLAFTPQGTVANVGTTGLPDFSTAFSANGGVIYLTSRTGKFSAITISPAGRVRSWKSNDASTWSN